MNKEQLRQIIKEEIENVLEEDRAFNLMKKVLGRNKVRKDPKPDGTYWFRGPMSREEAQTLIDKVNERAAGLVVALMGGHGPGYGLKVVKAGGKTIGEAVKKQRSLEDIAYELLADANKIKTPKGHGGFQVAWSEKAGSVDILHDTPRELRHEDEYDTFVDRRVSSEWDLLGRKLWKLLDRYRKRYGKLRFGIAGNVYGAGIKTSGRVNHSTL